jgi:hypothetical protein
MKERETAVWLLRQETRALVSRLDRIRPLVLTEPMLPAAAISPGAQMAIERYLRDGRQDFRRHVAEFTSWLDGPGQMTSPSEMQRRYTSIRLRFNEVLSDYDLFSDVITQRSEHEIGVWLAGLDALAADALRLRVPWIDMPQAICYLDRGPGAAIRRARTRLPTGGENPVAIIQVPRERMVGNGIASSLVHECGHQVAAVLGLVPSVRSILQGLQRSGGPMARVSWSFWERWISEILADFWSAARVGLTSTLGLIGVMSLPTWFVFRLNIDDPHPTPWLRVLISCAIGNALYPDNQWHRLASLWESLYPIDTARQGARAVLTTLRRAIPGLVTLLAEHRPPSLRGGSLRDVAFSPDRSPDRLSSYQASHGLSLPGLAAAEPTFAFAVIGQARAGGAIAPGEESSLVSDLLNRWALGAALGSRTLSDPSRASAHARPLLSELATGG